MPGTITHFWIFRQAVLGLPGQGIAADLKTSLTSFEERLRKDTSTWRSHYDFEEYRKDSLLASYGFFGATGPDLFLIPDDSWDAMGDIDGITLSDFMHYNKVSGFAIWMLDRLKKRLAASTNADYKSRLNNQLAYCLGYISHVAADVMVHPLVNTMAGAYPTNPAQQFENSEGSNGINIWKLHHKVEHYQDSYTRSQFFAGEASLPANDWEMLCFPRTACIHLLSDSSQAFIARQIESFYHYRDDSIHGAVTLDDELGKLDYFADDSVSASVSFRNYHVNIIPSLPRMNAERSALTGTEQSDLDTVVQPALFVQYVEKAIELTREMMGEALTFLYGGQNYRNKTDEDRKDLYEEKRQTFVLLRKNWNLDCGLGFEFETTPNGATFAAQQRTLHLPATMRIVAKPVSGSPPPPPPPPPPQAPKTIPAAGLPTLADKILLQEYLKGKRPGLQHCGYDLGDSGPDGDGVDGIVGSKTQAAVKQFQRDHGGGLKDDGIYGPKTQAAFDAEINGA